MAWRKVVSDLVPEIAEGWLCSSDVEAALLGMDEPDRVEFARELLKGTDYDGALSRTPTMTHGGGRMLVWGGTP